MASEKVVARGIVRWIFDAELHLTHNFSNIGFAYRHAYCHLRLLWTLLLAPSSTLIYLKYNRFVSLSCIDYLIAQSNDSLDSSLVGLENQEELPYRICLGNHARRTVEPPRAERLLFPFDFSVHMTFPIRARRSYRLQYSCSPCGPLES